MALATPIVALIALIKVARLTRRLQDLELQLSLLKYAEDREPAARVQEPEKLFSLPPIPDLRPPVFQAPEPVQAPQSPIPDP